MNQYRKRQLERYFLKESKNYPAILLTGPRQVGKSTILLHLKEEKRSYVTLDNPDIRQMARISPELFFEKYSVPILIDEVQYAPQLFPYIKMIIDQRQENDLFWLTGSQIYPMMQGVQESLAGRVRILRLDGFSRREALEIEQHPFPRKLKTMMKETCEPFSIGETLIQGSMPRLILQNEMDVQGFYQSYLDSYLARDVRSITNVLDTGLYLRFIRLLATRTGQELNLSTLARELSVDSTTIRRWVDILITSGLIMELQPYYRNLGKRIIKRPKIHFTDIGLVCYLCGIYTPETFDTHILKGNIFESWVISEIAKSMQNHGFAHNCYYFRDSNQKEIDLLIESDGSLYPFEIKLNDAPSHAAKNFTVLKEEDERIPYYGVLCPCTQLSPINERIWKIPVSLI